MLNCTQVTRLCSERLERPLTIKERMALNTHLMMCKGCRNFGKQMTDLRQLAQEYASKTDESDSYGASESEKNE